MAHRYTRLPICRLRCMSLMFLAFKVHLTLTL